jgi:hypothetical protein
VCANRASVQVNTAKSIFELVNVQAQLATLAAQLQALEQRLASRQQGDWHGYLRRHLSANAKEHPHMSHSISQLTSRVSRLAEQVQRAGVGACRKNHTPMPLVFHVREGEPFPPMPDLPSHCDCGQLLHHGRPTVHVIHGRPTVHVIHNMGKWCAKALTMKTCSHCKQTKPLDAFARRRGRADGRHNYCKPCASAPARARNARPPYSRWCSVRNRCLNPRHDNFRNYGGRGIALGPAWRDDYPAFRDWLDRHLGPCPRGCSLDRIDNDGPYAPGNLRWATLAEQAHNSRTAVFTEETACLARLWAAVGLPQSEIATRLAVSRTALRKVLDGTNWRSAARTLAAAAWPVVGWRTTLSLGIRDRRTRSGTGRFS